MVDTILQRCEALGLRLTDQRRIVAAVLEEADDHPDVERLYARACAVDPGISLATVYRTVKLFEEAGILEKHEFRDGRARYEDAERDHHDHLIDLNSGEVIEFVDAEIEALQERIAARLGYQLKGHRLELYGSPAQGRVAMRQTECGTLCHARSFKIPDGPARRASRPAPAPTGI